MIPFREYVSEADFDIKKFIASCKSQIDSFKESGNKEGEKFLQSIVDSYNKEGSLSPKQVQAASKFMKG